MVGVGVDQCGAGDTSQSGVAGDQQVITLDGRQARTNFVEAIVQRLHAVTFLDAQVRQFSKAHRGIVECGEHRQGRDRILHL